MRTPSFLPLAATTAALLAGCSNMDGGPYGPNTTASGAAADRQCQVFRSYRDRPIVNVMEECTRQMGEMACRRCLAD